MRLYVVVCVFVVFIFICVDDQSRISLRPSKMMPKISSRARVLQRYNVHSLLCVSLLFRLGPSGPFRRRRFSSGGRYKHFFDSSWLDDVGAVVYFKDASTLERKRTSLHSDRVSNRSQWFLFSSPISTLIILLYCVYERVYDDWRSLRNRLFSTNTQLHISRV